MKKILLTFALLFLSTAVFPCLIFLYMPGDHVIIGNHEDWAARDARVRFIPANGKLLGSVVFDFESEGLIQGGMNSAGFFFDGTATPYVPLDFSDKEEFKGKDLWLTLLQTSRTVSDAVAFIKRYKIPDFERVHIFLADRSGQGVIVGAYDGKLTFTWRTNPFQVLTNFNIVDPEYGGEQPCPRFAAATQILSGSGDPMNLAKQALQKTTQGELTVYSSLFDLTTGTVDVFYIGNFSKPFSFNLKEELKKGPHDILLSKLPH